MRPGAGGQRVFEGSPGALQDHRVDVADQIVGLGKLDEIGRLDHTALGMAPAGQRLEPDEGRIPKIHDRLKERLERIGRQPVADLGNGVGLFQWRITRCH